ncbi:Usp family protein [Natrarchaeobius oligotrophus]|uniref:Usp family protein n=1 Tax=Natrarchaeobius chitinivorans TaxID=1679083 RepID=A0A3N6PP94_NATCH|nr:Usp family protein [Natrarchaeobius chitinivorans]RQH00976.1 Usp family protein [Natrarchaeobius chitinivorans]
MVVVAVVSGTTRPDSVVVEAARRADDLETAVHVLYVQGLGWYANLEVVLSERLGVPTGIETVRKTCERRAERIAEPVLEEYRAVGRIGRPIDEIVEYTRNVDGDCVVIDAAVDWGAGFGSLFSDPLTRLRAENVLVVPVY